MCGYFARTFFILCRFDNKFCTMLKIGITGGIGSGKSMVSKIFASLGIPVFDADNWSKKIMSEDKELMTNLENTFGKIYNNGLLDRKKLAEQVFNDESKLQKLNSIVHPATISAWQNWAAEQNASYVIKEAAIMFESGTAGDLDFVIGVYAPIHMRIKRTMQRSNITREQVLDRMHKQIDETIKMRLCDAVIKNDESMLITPEIIALHEKFCNYKK